MLVGFMALAVVVINRPVSSIVGKGPIAMTMRQLIPSTVQLITHPKSMRLFLPQELGMAGRDRSIEIAECEVAQRG